MMTAVRTFFHGEFMTFLAKGGLMMIPLLVSSVLSLTVIIERGFFWWRLRKQACDTMILQSLGSDSSKLASAFAVVLWSLA
jgi:biopolymer transport protein ExbB/TolQ